jgi:hypothetical protein
MTNKFTTKLATWLDISYPQRREIAGSIAEIFKMAVRFYNELNNLIKYCWFLHKIDLEGGIIL